MKVLVACEESQRVTIEFRKLGHQAYSCDLLDCSGNHPEWHIKKDVTLLLNGNCIVSPFVHCDYNYKSDACIKAHKNFIHDCEQVHKQMKAISNPEWHHVSLKTLANIDFDMLDEKRKLVCDINHILKDGIRNLYKCENHISFEVLERYVIRKCDELIQHNRLKAFWFSYVARQLDEVRRNTIYLYTPYITAHRNR